MERELRALEQQWSSYGDTVHYANHPPIFSSCEGSFLFDSVGHPYLDLQMQYSAANLGYRNELIGNAIKAQLDCLPQLAPQHLHSGRIELAARLAATVQRAFGLRGRVHFNVGGSAAVEDAIKLVRKNTGRSRMLAFQGGYHGRTLACSAITSSYRYREGLGEFADRAEFIPFPYCFRCPYGQQRETCALYCASQFERRFEHEYTGTWNPRTGHSEFGGLFAEPVQGRGGYIVPPREYFQTLTRTCQEHGILVVDDEIQMGFFRTGKMWAAETLHFTPDIIVFGKALTNGLNPLSGIWAREELIGPDIWPPGIAHSTYASNPLGTAAANAVLDIFAETDYESIVQQKGERFLSLLKELAGAHPEIGHVDGAGLALRLELCCSDGITPDPAFADRIFQLGLGGNITRRGETYGMILDVGGYHKNVLTIAPSLNISDEEMILARDLLDVLLEKCKTVALP